MADKKIKDAHAPTAATTETVELKQFDTGGKPPKKPKKMPTTGASGKTCPDCGVGVKFGKCKPCYYNPKICLL